MDFFTSFFLLLVSLFFDASYKCFSNFILNRFYSFDPLKFCTYTMFWNIDETLTDIYRNMILKATEISCKIKFDICQFREIHQPLLNILWIRMKIIIHLLIFVYKIHFNDKISFKMWNYFSIFFELRVCDVIYLFFIQKRIWYVKIERGWK